MGRKDQYTNTFKRWKFRKNGKADEWRSIAPQPLRQSVVEKCINIQFIGTASRISKAKALRAANRYGHQTMLEKFMPGESLDADSIMADLNNQPEFSTIRRPRPASGCLPLIQSIYHAI